jgi:hypothetical protein
LGSSLWLPIGSLAGGRVGDESSIGFADKIAARMGKIRV